MNSTLTNCARYGRNVAYDLLFFYYAFLSPLTSLIDFFSLSSQSISLSQLVFFPQIKPKNLLSSLFTPQIKLQFPVQNKTQKWNHHKPRKNKGIGDGGEVELGAKDGEAMKISVEVRSESWVAGASGFWLSVQVDSWLWVGDASSFVGLGCWC